MRTDRRAFLASLLAAALLGVPATTFAQALEVPMLDPWVPPAVAEKARAAPVPATDGEALRAQVRAKLKRRFDAAAGAAGTLTRGQARAAGLGAIALEFEAIDRAGRGAIRFEDYERHLGIKGSGSNPTP